MSMKAARMAELKSGLFRHLCEVRRGPVITVRDRETPIALLVPIASDADVTITPSVSDTPPVGKVNLLPPIKLNLDVVGRLLAGRRRRLRFSDGGRRSSGLVCRPDSTSDDGLA